MFVNTSEVINIHTRKKTTDKAIDEKSIDLDMEIYTRLSAATSLDDFNKQLEELVLSFGFSNYAFVRLSGNYSDLGFLNFPMEMTNLYIAEKFYEVDMIMPYATENTKPIFHSIIDQHFLNAPIITEQIRRNQSRYNLNVEYGFYDYYTTPRKSAGGKGNVMLSVGLKGMGSKELQLRVAHRERALNTLCEAVDYISYRKFPEKLFHEHTIEINAQPLRVLDALANSDMTMAQIADKLDIGVDTANRHIACARKAFGVRTNYAAIKSAVLAGLIEYKKSRQ